jgi:hypothetical protein
MKKARHSNETLRLFKRKVAATTKARRKKSAIN